MKNGMSVCFSGAMHKIIDAGNATVVTDPKGEAGALFYRGRSRGQAVVGLSSPPAFYSESYRLECVAALLIAKRMEMV